MRYLQSTLAVLFSLTFFVGCKQKDREWIERYQRSVRNDIDLFLIAERYAVLESSWLNHRALARFDRAQLENELRRYGRTLDDLKREPAYAYKEIGSEVHMQVGRISHSTAYDYDVDIPLLFHGKWFAPGQYSTIVYQQHITPTLAKVLGVRNPNGVEVEALPIIRDSVTKPDLVAVVVLDQGGMQLLHAHPNRYPRIRQLMQSSANFTHAQVGHLDAHTAVGHMAIGTGAFPRKSEVIGNTFFSLEKKAGVEKLILSEIYAGKDQQRVNPAELKAETLADVVNQASQNRNVVLSQSYALRASMGMGGHGVTNSAPGQNLNFIYWLDSHRSEWITDTRYYALPQPARNASVLPNFRIHYPKGYETVTITDLTSAKKNWGVMMATPAQAKFEGDLMRANIQKEIIDAKRARDGFSDLVYLSFKAPDAAGHRFGYLSLEAADTLAAVDTAIGEFVDFLQKYYSDNFALVLTADHGCAPLSEISGGQRLTAEEVIATIDTLLPDDERKQSSLVRFMTVGQISLNHELMQKHKISLDAVVKKILGIKAGAKPFFRAALTRKDIGVNE